jgi:hypothetical protein
MVDYKRWPGTESNRRRQPFQGCALPTELPGHFAAEAPVYQTVAVIKELTPNQIRRQCYQYYVVNNLIYCAHRANHGRNAIRRCDR